MDINFSTYKTIDTDKFLDFLKNQGLTDVFEEWGLRDAILQIETKEYINEKDILSFVLLLYNCADKTHLTENTFSFDGLSDFVSKWCDIVENESVTTHYSIDTIYFLGNRKSIN